MHTSHDVVLVTRWRPSYCIVLYCSGVNWLSCAC